MSELEFHPIANIFPLIEGEELRMLVADIAEHGVRQPVWLFEGKVLDGRNRVLAAKKAGKEFKTKAFKGSRLEALQFSWSLNRPRRHLTSSQAAIVEAQRAQQSKEYAAEIEKLKAEAAERKKEGGKKAGKGRPLASGNVSGRSPETNEARAEAAGTNRKYLEAAEKLAKTHPDLAERVKNGELSIKAAMKEAEAREAKPEEPEELLDEVGKVLPGNVRADFERASEFDDIVRDLHGIKKRIETLAADPLGKFLPAGPCGADIENAKRQVKHSRPYAVCVYCKDKPGKGCRACKDGGWITKGLYTAAPESMK